MNTNSLYRGLPFESSFDRPSGIHASTAATSSRVPWGHVAAELVAAGSVATTAFVVGSGTVAIGKLMVTQPQYSPVLSGALVVGVAETTGRGGEVVLHLQAAFEYATSDKPLAEIEASIKQRAEVSLSSVGAVAAQASGSKQFGEFAEKYSNAAIAAMSALSNGIGVFARDVSAPIEKSLKELDVALQKGTPMTAEHQGILSPLAMEGPVNEKSEAQDKDNSGHQSPKPVQYEPVDKPASEESKKSQTSL
ncbi:hypothetical protein [Thauera sp.]|uniref:hypothetical protein n=1 Tax=Thauera sp. TaxID=1905334 RepID=UPI001B5152F7|nr:hypothetical protein [Thauera sp.]MBP6130276.1 hypothetical protein [Thauera sp.]